MDWFFGDMAIVVPESDNGLGKVVFVAQNTQARRAQQQISPPGWFEPEPAGGQHPKEVSTGKKNDVRL